MLAGFFLNATSFLLLFTIVHFGCWTEYLRLLQKINPAYATHPLAPRLLAMLTGWSIVLLLSGAALPVSPEVKKWLVAGLATAWLLSELVTGRKLQFRNLQYSVAGLCYISLSIGLLNNLYMEDSRWPWFLPLFILCCMWINDTMAYLVGSFIGKTPFSKISPKKTWEGTGGGAVLCVVIVGLAASFIAPERSSYIPAYHWYSMAAIAAVTGTAGDLLESKLKRTAGVKDSGTMMPGHGGFLDRFDSLLVATPFIWLYIYLFVR
jgi:phosphatidate cytidylyltransferase